MLNIEKLSEFFQNTDVSKFSKEFYLFRKTDDDFDAYKVSFNLDEYVNDLFDFYEYFVKNKFNDILAVEENSSKTCIDFIDESIFNDNTPIEQIINAITHYNSFRFDNSLTFKGYVIKYIFHKSKSNEIIFYTLHKNNPVKYMKKNKHTIFSRDTENKLTKVSKDIISLPKHIDAIIFNNEAYLFNQDVREYFDCARAFEKQKNSFVEQITNSNIFDDDSLKVLCSYCNKKSTTNLFSELDNEMVSHLINNPTEVAKSLNLYHKDGEIILSDKDDAEKLVKLVTGCGVVGADKNFHHSNKKLKTIPVHSQNNQ